MAQEELDVSLFTEQAVTNLLGDPPAELQEAVKKAFSDALANSEVKQAFLAMFTAEERESLASADPDELAAALRQELAGDESFHNAMRESVGQWVAEVKAPIPQSAEELDSIITQWQIPTGDDSPQGATQHQTTQHGTEHRPGPAEPPATGVSPA